MPTKECHVFYSLEARVTHKSTHLVPDSLLQPVPEDNWSSFDLARACDPLVWKGNRCIRTRPAGHEDRMAVWQRTHQTGWFNIRNAKRALNAVRRADAEGEHDSRDGYGKLLRRVRHEFRLMRNYYHCSKEPV